MKLRAFLFSLLLLSAFVGCSPRTHSATSTSPEATVHEKRSNKEVRQWYNDEVATIDAKNEEWIKAGLSAEDRAHKAYDIRHNARISARKMMRSEAQVKKLQKRDQEKYGNPDGPTFEYLYAKNKAKGLEGDAIYEAIIGSSTRTNKEVNDRFGVDGGN